MIPFVLSESCARANLKEGRVHSLLRIIPGHLRVARRRRTDRCLVAVTDDTLGPSVPQKSMSMTEATAKCNHRLENLLKKGHIMKIPQIEQARQPSVIDGEYSGVC